MPANESQDYDLIDQMADDFAARLRRGEKPSLQEYIDRHPKLANEIRELLPAMVELEHAQKEFGDQGQAIATAGKQPHLRQLGDFHILREIGHGGMGVVYEAEQVSLGRRVALKVITRKTLSDPKQKRRFEREAKAAAKLHHTNIVPVFGFGEHEGTPYYVMQFIQGTGLDEVINEVRQMRPSGSRPLSHTELGEELGQRRDISATQMARSLMTGNFQPADEANGDATPMTESYSGPHITPPMPVAASTDNLSATLAGSSSSVVFRGMKATGSRQSKKLTYFQSVARIGVQVADALEYAHQQGIQHRDIKPSNLLLDVRGTTWVTDFGLAKLDDQQNLTHTGDILGTLRYMPPEAFEGRTDVRSDVYSLGLTLYEMLAYTAAFREKERARLIKQVTTEEAPRLNRINPSIPRDLVTIVHKAMERDPNHRYATATELAADLQRFLDDEPIKARRLSASEKTWRWCRRNPVVASLSAALFLLLAGVTVASLLMAAYFDDIANREKETAKNERTARQEEKEAKEREAELRVQAETALKEAEKERIRAEANFGKARSAVDDYLVKVSESQLLQVPGLQPLRRQLMQSALTFYQDFLKARGDDPRVRAGLASAFLKAGKIQRELEQHAQANAAYADALKLYAKLAKADPQNQDWLHGQAQCYSSLGEYDKAAEIWKRLVKPGEAPYQKELADAYNSLAVVTHKNDLTKYLEDHQNALAIREMLVQLNPNDPEAQRDLGGTLNNLGVILATKNNHTDALGLYLRGVKHAEAAYNQAPSALIYSRFLVIGTANVGNTYNRLGDKQEAVRWLEKAVAIKKRMAAENPSIPSFQSALATEYGNLHRFYRDLGKEAEAVRAARQARAVAERLPKDNSGDLYNLACFRALCAETPEGRTLTDDERGELREQADLALTALRQSLAAGYKDLNNIKSDMDLKALRDRADFKELIAKLEADLEIEDRAKKAEALAAAAKTPEEKLKARLEAEENRKKLAASDPDNRRLQADHAASLHAIGLIQIEAGRTKEGALSLEQAMALREQLVRDDPKNSQFKADLASSHLGYGDMHWKAGRLVQATQFWQKGLLTLENANLDEPGNQLLKTQRDAAEFAIGDAYGRAFLWKEAAFHYGKVCWKDSNSASPVLSDTVLNDTPARFAQLLLRAGEEEKYSALCDQFIKRLAGGPNKTDDWWIAFACSQSPSAKMAPTLMAQIFERQAALWPTETWLENYKRNAYLRAGRLEEAIKEPDKIQDPLRRFYILAMAYHKLGKADEARKWLRQGDDRLKLDNQWHFSARFRVPDQWWHYAELTAFAKMAHETIEGVPFIEDVRLTLHQAEWYFKLDQKDKAEAYFKNVVSAHSQDPSVWLARARTYAALGLLERAEADFAKGIELKPDDATTWIARARYFMERGKQKEADADYAKAASLTPDELTKFVEAGWWVVGPYPEDINTPYPPENNPDPSQRVASVNGGGDLAWQSVATQVEGKVDLRAVFNADHICVYALTYVYSPDERTALVGVGGDDNVRLWVNGLQVHETTKVNGWISGLDHIPVTLHTGRNTILAKVKNITRDHYFLLRLGDGPIERVLAFAEHGLWKEAADALVKASPAGLTEIAPHWFAALLYGGGQKEAYRSYRKQLLNRAESPIDAYSGLELAFACSLEAGSEIDYAPLVKQARQYKEPDPNNHWNNFFLGTVLYRAGQFEKALRVLEAAEPRDIRPWPVLAMIHHRLGHAEQARMYLRKVDDWFENETKKVLANSNTSPLSSAKYWHDGLWIEIFHKEAKTRIEGKDLEVAALKTIHERSLNELTRGDKLMAAYNDAVMVENDQPRVWLARGRRYLELNRIKEAEADLVKAGELNSKDPYDWKKRGEIYAEMGQPDKAAADFAKALDLAPKDEHWDKQLSWALQEVAIWKDAYEKLVQLRPDNAFLLISRGRSNLRRGLWKEAALDFKKVIDNRPVSDEWIDAATALLLAGDEAGYQEVIRKLAQKVKEGGNQVTPSYILARTGSLSKTPPVETMELVQAGRRAMNVGKNGPWRHHALGLALFRAGAIEEAIASFQNCKVEDIDEFEKVHYWQDMALVHAKAGKSAEARQCLDKLEEIVRPFKPASPGKLAQVYGGDWGEYQMLLREIEELLAEKKP